MQSGNNLNQFSDDDFFSDGPCPSCRLAINKETGRLKCDKFHIVYSLHISIQISYIFNKWVNLLQNSDGVQAEVKHGVFVSNWCFLYPPYCCQSL